MESSSKKRKSSENLPEKSKRRERQEKFVENIALGYGIREAALRAGYSKSSCRSYAYLLLQKPHVVEIMREYSKRIPEARQRLAAVRLLRVVKIEDKLLKKAEKDPELVAKYPKIVEREYKLAGLLNEETQQAQQIINVKELKVVRSALRDMISETIDVGFETLE